MSRRRSTPKADPASELTLDQLESELKELSARISRQVRTVNVGILALAWTLLLKGKDVQPLVAKMPDKALLLVALLCILSVAADFCQYLFAETAVDATYDRAAASKTRTAGYDAECLSYRAQVWFYRAKLLLTAFAAIVVVILIAHALFT
jgi:hypothetical protein